MIVLHCSIALTIRSYRIYVNMYFSFVHCNMRSRDETPAASRMDMKKSLGAPPTSQLPAQTGPDLDGLRKRVAELGTSQKTRAEETTPAKALKTISRSFFRCLGSDSML